MPVIQNNTYYSNICTIYGLQLAALHFNEKSNHEQAVTKEGEEMYHTVFPKYKKGGYIVRKVLKDPTYSQLLFCNSGILLGAHVILQITFKIS